MERAAKIFVYLVAANFIAFGIASLWFGGDAIEGRVIGGHYFLNYKGHFTEVSRAVFVYSGWHAFSVFITFPLAWIIGLALGTVGRDDAPRKHRPVRDLRM
jgi:hypothetical protein